MWLEWEGLLAHFCSDAVCVQIPSTICTIVSAVEKRHANMTPQCHLPKVTGELLSVEI